VIAYPSSEYGHKILVFELEGFEVGISGLGAAVLAPLWDKKLEFGILSSWVNGRGRFIFLSQVKSTISLQGAADNAILLFDAKNKGEHTWGLSDMEVCVDGEVQKTSSRGLNEKSARPCFGAQNEAERVLSVAPSTFSTCFQSNHERRLTAIAWNLFDLTR
jgi:hypothetical protein